jgi:hypothetical protein
MSHRSDGTGSTPGRCPASTVPSSGPQDSAGRSKIGTRAQGPDALPAQGRVGRSWTASRASSPSRRISRAAASSRAMAAPASVAKASMFALPRARDETLLVHDRLDFGAAPAVALGWHGVAVSGFVPAGRRRRHPTRSVHGRTRPPGRCASDEPTRPACRRLTCEADESAHWMNGFVWLVVVGRSLPMSGCPKWTARRRVRSSDERACRDCASDAPSLRPEPVSLGLARCAAQPTRAIEATMAPVTMTRSVGASSTWRPRRPAETKIVGSERAAASMTVGRRRR